jgi:hypothetical protein
MILTLAYDLWGVNEQEMGREGEIKKAGYALEASPHHI